MLITRETSPRAIRTHGSDVGGDMAKAGGHPTPRRLWDHRSVGVSYHHSGNRGFPPLDFKIVNPGEGKDAGSGEDVLDDAALDVGEAEVPALKLIGQLLVIDAQQVRMVACRSWT